MTIAEAVAKWPDDAREAYEERAAIMEHEGKMTRERAELRAYVHTAARFGLRVNANALNATLPGVE